MHYLYIVLAWTLDLAKLSKSKLFFFFEVKSRGK